MPNFGLLTGTQQRSYGGLPTLPLINMIAESAVTEPTQFIIQSRPALQKYLTTAWASGVPLRALYYTENTSMGNFFGVYSTSFYNNADASSTTLNGSLVPSIVGNEIGVVAAAGSAAKWWDGVAFRSISFPDGASVTKVMETQGRFIFIRADSQKYYWTEPLSNMIDGSGDIVIDSLDFASAEDEEDWLVDGLAWSDNLVFGGTRSIEIHSVTGDDNLPWARIPGSTINKGVFATGAMAQFDGSFAWASPERAIWKYDGTTHGLKLSNAGIEERLKFYDTITLDSFFWEGREFLHVYGDAAYPDLVFDASTDEWCEWESNDGPFDAGPSVNIGEDYPVFGAKTVAHLVGMSNRSSLPGGTFETSVEKRFRFGVPIDGDSVTIHNILLRCQTYAPGSDTISLRTSRDKGNNWTSYDAITFDDGLRQKIEWRSRGMADSPGFLCEVKTTASAFSVSGALYNEFVTGRARE